MAKHLGDWAWHFMTEENGQVNITYEDAAPVSRMRALVEAGVSSNAEIAEMLGVSKGCVSKWAKQGQKARWMIIKGRQYLPVKA